MIPLEAGEEIEFHCWFCARETLQVVTFAALTGVVAECLECHAENEL